MINAVNVKGLLASLIKLELFSLSFDEKTLSRKSSELFPILSKYFFESNFNYIQLHFKLNDEIFNFLIEQKSRKKIISIYDPRMNDEYYLNRLINISTIVIFDNIEGGTGIPVKISKKLINKKCNFMIAGGINLINIRPFKDKFNPFGFDIQSSAEICKGVKDFDYIKKLQHEII